jgi:hypothetical protein
MVMNFLRKLFKKDDSTQQKPDVASGEKKIFKPRAIRVPSTLLYDLTVKIQQDANLISVPVVNISTSGLAFEVEQEMELSTELTGSIDIEGRSFEVKMRVTRADDGVVGCEFVEAAGQLLKTFVETHKMQLVAGAFHEVNSQFLQKSDQGEAHWFVDRSGNEIYFISNAHQAVHFHIAIGSGYVEGDGDGNLRTGSLVQDDDDRNFEIKGSRRIKFDSSPNPEVIAKAGKLLDYVGLYCRADFNTIRPFFEIQSGS